MEMPSFLPDSVLLPQKGKAHVIRITCTEKNIAQILESWITLYKDFFFWLFHLQTFILNGFLFFFF